MRQELGLIRLIGGFLSFELLLGLDGGGEGSVGFRVSTYAMYESLLPYQMTAILSMKLHPAIKKAR